ncbi:MAG: high-potential iron-sulfur protein [Gammaproteobacteria bacterium]|nr:high-potential iron-sulfur protein [Gammaproteobacteria bacterium]
MSDKNLSRRRFLQQVAVAVPAGAMLLDKQAGAADMPKLDPADLAAAALLYVEDAADVDTSNPMAARFEPGQNCANCVQIQGEDGAAWRPCAIFPGKVVASAGWCSVWAPMP